MARARLLIIVVGLFIVMSVGQGEAYGGQGLKLELKRPPKPELRPEIRDDIERVELAGDLVPLVTRFKFHEKTVNGQPVYADSYRESPINTGPIPPNFVHTWGITVVNMDRFRFRFIPLPDNQILMNNGDYLKVYDSNGNMLQMQDPTGAIKDAYFTDQVGLDKAIILTGYDPMRANMSTSEKLIFLELGTSGANVPRRAKLKGLVNVSEQSYAGEPRAILLGDDLNYDANGFLIQEKCIGRLEGLPKPWPNSGPKPTAEDGWHLVGRNIYNQQQKFASIVYYNEAQGKLRLYLFNNIGDAMLNGYKISLYFQKFAGGKWVDMKGAFFQPTIFKADSGLEDWSRLDVLLPIKWQYRDWIKMDIPILYPMESKTQGENLSSLYEDLMSENVRLMIEVMSILKGDMSAMIKLKGSGEAIQTFDETVNENSTWSVLMGAADKVKSGVTTGMSAGATAGSIIPGLGTAMGGIIGGVIGGFASLFGLSEDDPVDPIPIKLSLTLAMSGKMIGDVSFTGQKFQNVIYLPGRFSYLKAINEGDINTAAIDINNSMLPRYDRTMGLFGFKKDPTMHKTDVDVYYLDSGNNSTLTTYSYPHYGGQNGFKVEKSLPVIYNPYAEIIPAAPVSPKPKAMPFGYFWVYGSATLPNPPKRSGESPEYPYDKYFYWEGDISWQTNVTPEPDDATFPHKTVTQKVIKGDSIEQQEQHVQEIVDYGEEQFGECSNMYIHINYPPVGGPIGRTMEYPTYDDFRDAPWAFQKRLNNNYDSILKSVVPQFMNYKGGFCQVSSSSTFYGDTGRPVQYYLIETQSPVEGSLMRPFNNGLWLSIVPTNAQRPGTYSNFKEYSNLPVHTYYYSIEKPESIVFYWQIEYFYYPRSRKDEISLSHKYKGEALLYSPVDYSIATGAMNNPYFNDIQKATETVASYKQKISSFLGNIVN